MTNPSGADLAYLDDAVARRLATKAIYDALNSSGAIGDYYVVEYAPADGGPVTRVFVGLGGAVVGLSATISRLEQMLDSKGVNFNL